MATVQRTLVHKQFNSPLGLYSQQNVEETLDRELKAFGAKGIKIDDKIPRAPANLAQSAVLRAVEEEEQIKCGYKRVAWPPPTEDRVVREFTPQPQPQTQPPPGQYQSPAAAQYQQQPPTAAPTQQQYRTPSYDQYQQQYPTQVQPPYQVPQQQPREQAPPQQQYQQPPWVRQQQQQQPAPHPQAQYQAPAQPHRPPSTYQYHQPQSQQSPVVPPANQFTSYPQPQQPYQQRPFSQDQPDHQQQKAQSLPHDYRGGSPGIITLRKEAPVTQKPAPVYTSQPAAVSYQGGGNMRGDLKWPPPEYKEAAARENEERRKLALGPVCRPRRVHRDYTAFFAKNALNSYYPGYKVPPGTQHMIA